MAAPRKDVTWAGALCGRLDWAEAGRLGANCAWTAVWGSVVSGPFALMLVLRSGERRVLLPLPLPLFEWLRLRGGGTRLRFSDGLFFAERRGTLGSGCVTESDATRDDTLEDTALLEAEEHVEQEEQVEPEEQEEQVEDVDEDRGRSDSRSLSVRFLEGAGLLVVDSAECGLAIADSVSPVLADTASAIVVASPPVLKLLWWFGSMGTRFGLAPVSLL